MRDNVQSCNILLVAQNNGSNEKNIFKRDYFNHVVKTNTIENRIKHYKYKEASNC